MTLRPHEYQREGVAHMEGFLAAGGGTLLADDMGLGKTLQALLLLKRLRAGAMLPALVVCPASIKYTWEHAAFEHIGVRAFVLEGKKPPKSDFGFQQQILIINPDILADWLEHLRGIGLQTIILDECQYFTNPRAKRTRAAMLLAAGVRMRIAMSGTPLTNRPGELWPVLHILRPDVFPSLFTFAEEFCKPRKEFGKWVFKGAKNLPRLHKLLKKTCMVRRLKKDVMKDLPEKVRMVHAMEVSDMAEYVQARDNFGKWIKENYTGQRARAALRAQAVTQIGYLLRLTARLKCRAVVAWVNNFLETTDEKIAIYVIHKKMIDVMQRRISYGHVTIDGTVTGRLRKCAVDRFRNDPQTRVFLANIQAACAGIDGLQDVCRTMAFGEIWWRPGDLIQAEDRLHRIGQHGHVRINYLLAAGTIEEDLCKIVQEKQGIIGTTLDGDGYKSDIDIFDQLIEKVTKGTK